MNRNCLKCGHVAEVSDDPMAECPKCGAIYAKVEAAKAANKVRRQLASARARADASNPAPRPNWFTPRLAKFLFAVFTLVFILPAFISAGISPTTAGVAIAIGSIVVALLAAVLLEAVLVVFHIANSIDDCRDALRQIAASTADLSDSKQV